jgi:hypothetical protein
LYHFGVIRGGSKNIEGDGGVDVGHVMVPKGRDEQARGLEEEGREGRRKGKGEERREKEKGEGRREKGEGRREKGGPRTAYIWPFLRVTSDPPASLKASKVESEIL